MNSFDPIDPALIDAPLHVPHDGYPAHLAAEDTPDALREAAAGAARDFPQALWIDPKDWPDRARDNDKYKTWPINFIDRYTHQGNSHECTCHSLSRCFEGARNRQIGVIFADGPKKSYRYPESDKYGTVWVAPNSIYPEANPGRYGGANVRQVMEIACRRGMLPEKVQPKDYGFKHAVYGTAGGTSDINQSNGPWLRVGDFPEGWQETAKWFKPLEVIFASSWEQAVCLVMHGIFVGVGRSGHAIPWGQARFEGGNFAGMAYPDSYNVTRYDSAATVKSAWRGSFAIASVTAPDSWDKPIGG